MFRELFTRIGDIQRHRRAGPARIVLHTRHQAPARRVHAQRAHGSIRPGASRLTPVRFGRAAAVLLIATAAVAVHPVGVAAQDGSEVDAAEVRIAARRVAGERVEFALQQRAPGGDWGAMSLPRQRFFPLRTAEGRWLASTPLRPAGAAEVRIAGAPGRR